MLKLIKNKAKISNITLKIKKQIFYSRNYKLFLNNKSYYKKFSKLSYKRFFFNKFSRKLIRRIILILKNKIMKKIKYIKERKKRIIFIMFFEQSMELMKKHIILRRLQFFKNEN